VQAVRNIENGCSKSTLLDMMGEKSENISDIW
jgi:hypothetical protein